MELSRHHINELLRSRPFALYVRAAFNTDKLGKDKAAALALSFKNEVKTSNPDIAADFDPVSMVQYDTLQIILWSHITKYVAHLDEVSDERAQRELRRNLIEEWAKHEPKEKEDSLDAEWVNLFSAYVYLNSTDWFLSFEPYDLHQGLRDWRQVLENHLSEFRATYLRD